MEASFSDNILPEGSMETNTTDEYSPFSGVFGGEHHFESIEDASFSVYNSCVALRDNARCKLPATVSFEFAEVQAFVDG